MINKSAKVNYYKDLNDIVIEPPPDAKGAIGICLDEEHSLLYVSDNTNSIKYYNTTDWSKEGEISASCNVLGLAIDVEHQYLYYGTMPAYGQYNTNLYKYNLTTPSTSSVDVGSSIVGIAADEESGLVYLTTFEDGNSITRDRLMIYNSSLVKQSFESGDIGDPAGLAIAADVGYKDPNFIIVKDNNDVQNNCVHPGDFITFNISWDANDTEDANVILTDYLPKELDYISSDPCGEYNPLNRTVIWDLNSLTGNEFGTFQITAYVNGRACPCGKISNKAAIESDDFYSESIVDVNVCTFGNGIIYVDEDVNGFRTGTSWENSYTDLQDALAGARRCPDFFDAIWVAEGIYKPAKYYIPNNYDVNFALVGTVDLIGHFRGDETSKEQRDLKDANFITILDGQIGTQYDQSVMNVLTANSEENISDVNIDGFLIKGGYKQDAYGNYIGNGIYLYNAENISLINCIIGKNYGYGIYSYNSSTNVRNCVINDNTYFGIALKDCKQTEIINSLIHNNTYNGIDCDSSNTFSPIIRNNTIYQNDIGIFVNSGPDPNIRNCIIYDNMSGDLGGSFYNVNYCCFTYEYSSGTGNIYGNPLFYDADANNLHLTLNSPCKITGSIAGIPTDEKDIDGEPRVWDGHTSIGADNYYWSPADFNSDTVVDFYDYCLIANAWLTTPIDAEYDDTCDIVDNDSIDIEDLELFSADWLWRPGWIESWVFQSEGQQMMMQQGGGDFLKMVVESMEKVSIQEQSTISEEDIKETINWLDEIWQDGSLKDTMTEEEFLDFIEAVEDSPI